MHRMQNGCTSSEEDTSNILHFAGDTLEHVPLASQVLLCCHSNTNRIINHTLRANQWQEQQV